MTDPGPHDTDLALSDAEADFVANFRSHASTQGWAPCLAPDDWYQGMSLPDENGRCLAWIDVVADNTVLLTVGACFNGQSTRVGELHSQLFTLSPGHSRCPPAHFDGPVQNQARLAADWVHQVLLRPIERRDWSEIAREWRFADDGTPLVVSGPVSKRHGPPAQVTRVPPESGPNQPA
jgi:hypothetical protein